MKRVLQEAATLGTYIIIGTLLALAVCTAGCKPDPQQSQPQSPAMPKAVMPEGLRDGDTVAFRYRADAGKSQTNEHVTGTGAGAEATGAELNQSLAGSAPNASLSAGGGATGGSLKSRIVAVGGDANGMALMGVGIALIITAGAALYFGLKRAAIFLGIGGAGFIVAALLPAWAWIVLAAVAVIGGGVYLWAEYGGKRSHEALRAVAAGVADTKKNAPETYAMVKERIAAHADTSDIHTIAKIKTKDRL